MSVYIIAEAGSNHNQSLDTARHLIQVAADAGANACKFQLFNAEKLCARRGVPCSDDFRGHELPPEWIENLYAECMRRGIDFMCSVFDKEDVPLVSPFVSYGKVACSEAANSDLMCGWHGKGVILSVRRSELHETWGYLSMLCVPQYPAPVRAYHPLWFRREGVGGTGYDGISDHTTEISLPALAVAHGARFVEKHFTLDKNQEGPDHHYALEPDELKTMVKMIRETEEMLMISWAFFSYMFWHKWYVFRESLRLGIPLRGILHDLGKFRPSEAIPYILKWNVGTERQRRSFMISLMLHQKRNPHHFQWWLYLEGEGGSRTVSMSEGALREMVADWAGALRTKGKPLSPRLWYEQNSFDVRLHPDSRSRLVKLLEKHYPGEEAE